MSVRPVASDEYLNRHAGAMRFTSDLTQLLIDNIDGVGRHRIRVYDDAEDAHGVARDLSGVDAEMEFAGTDTTVAYRVRPDEEKRTDVSIRSEAPHGGESEWQAWQAYQQGDEPDREVPDYLVHALHDGGEITRAWLLDVDDFLELTFATPERWPEYQSSDGSGGYEGRARYVQLPIALQAACEIELTSGDSK